MDIHGSHDTDRRSVHPETNRAKSAWTAPRFEVIALDCEITAYAPDGDGPLF
jgi:hypothetical protein